MPDLTDVTDWNEVAWETRGKRSKCWVADPGGRLWLRKEHREGRPYEPAIESRARGLARACGMAAALGRACVWRAGSTRRHGIVVLQFLSSATEQLSQGFEELTRADPGYDPEDYAQHTIARVRDCLTKIEATEANASLLVPFARLLVFDAWLGNGDRHPGNWGIVRSPGVAPRLSPMYDPAACLGAELQESSVRKLLSGGRDAIARYIERCPSGFGDGSEIVRQSEVVRAIGNWQEVRQNAPRWLARFRSAMDTFGVPAFADSDGLPPERLELARCLLQSRLGWLEVTL
jgi:hypothetical protein